MRRMKTLNSVFQRASHVQRPMVKNMTMLATTEQDEFFDIHNKQLTLDNMNPNVKRMAYTVGGPLVMRANEIDKELARGVKKPFKKVTHANIGDAHAMGQLPITFIRQVLAACSFPELIDTVDFPSDVKQRAHSMLKHCSGGSIGAYSASVGIELIRQHAAEYIRDRDGGVPANPDDIILSGSASDCIRSLLKLFTYTTPDGKPPGVMIPIPQYPLYNVTVAEFGMHQISYYLNEDNNWSLDVPELKRAINEARSKCNPRVICVINPGNPTGQVLRRQNIEEIIKFAKEEDLFVFADEVYQENIHDPACKFHSFKKVLREMGPPYADMELASFHSASKGYTGECGMRGGYTEVVNVDPNVMAQFKKSISPKTCSSVTAQIVLDCIFKPPKPGDPSYELFAEEKAQTVDSLAKKAKMIHEAFNSIEGFKCNPVQGSMFAFPRLFLPPKAIETARSLNQAPDFFYVLQLLENTGICIAPGAGFCQRDGTYHIRMTILPPESVLQDILHRIKQFHLRFLEEYK